MAVTTKVTGSSSTYATAANTRLGDGIRATASPHLFSPISEAPASAELSLKDQGLRNDEWGKNSMGRDEAAGEEHSSSPRADVPVRLGRVFTSNDVSRLVFALQPRLMAPPASRYLSGGLYANRDASEIYESNTRIVMARQTGRKDPGGLLDCFY